MRKQLNIIIVLILLVTILACDLSLSQAAKPTITLTAPAANSSVALNQEIMVQAVVADPKGVSRVELWADGQQVFVQAVAPAATSYAANLPWTPAVPGSHILEVQAYNIENTAADPAQLILTAGGEGQAQSTTEVPATTPPDPGPDADTPEPTAEIADDGSDTLSTPTEVSATTPAVTSEPATSAPTTPASTPVPTTPAPTAVPTTPVPTAIPTTPVPTPVPTTPPPTATPDRLDVGQTGACAAASKMLDLPGGTCSSNAAFSPDGNEVAIMARDGVYVISTEGGAWRELIVPPGYSPGGDIVWSPWGEYIAYVYNDNGTLKVGVTRSHGTTPNELWSITPEEKTDWPRWTTDQRLLVTSGSDYPLSTVYVVWMSGPPAEVRPAPTDEVFQLSASGPGQQYYPWKPGKTWTGNKPGYEAD